MERSGRRRGERGDGTTGRSPAAVYDRLAPAVLGWFRGCGVADPEALTGDVFLAVTARLADFDGDDDALRRWVFTIAHHKRVDEVRRVRRRPVEVDEEPDPTPAHDPDPVDPELVAALDRLTTDQREVVLLRVVADLAVDDVARITGRSQGSVKMLLSRGLAALRADPGLAGTDADPPEPGRSPT